MEKSSYETKNMNRKKCSIQSNELQFYNDTFLKQDTISFRQYQANILKKCRNKNSLVVLPTGLGKTIIAILLIAKKLKKYQEHGKILILAPTRPLVAQHLSSCQKFLNLNHEKISLLTGRISPEKRIITFRNSRIIISTPQVIKNDVLRGRYSLKNVVLTIFDEAHRTKGNYAYTFLSKEYIKKCKDPLILALTASPGKDYDNIQELCNNLFIENIIFKTFEDPDVEKYIHEIDVFLEKVALPINILEISQIIENLFQKFLEFFTERNLLSSSQKYYSKMTFLQLAQDLSFSLQYGDLFSNEACKEELYDKLHFNDPPIIEIVREKKLNVHSIFSYCSSCISLLHAKELLETQHIYLFKSFLEKLQYKTDQDNKSARRIISSDHFHLINSLLEEKYCQNLIHPKIDRLLKIISEEITTFHNHKILVFTQYREMAAILESMINQTFPNKIRAEKFIGQSTTIHERGFSQKRQIEILNDFRNNKIDVLTATSVAEEGLDIPNVDAIIFFEPVASEIRHIQRRGRTGRHSPGRCYILIAKDSVDVPFYIVAKKKEDTMNSVLIDPYQLDLTENLQRQEICFNDKEGDEDITEYEILKNYRSRRKKEKELLANRSIEEIIENIDTFSKSKKYNHYKNQGVTFLSDLVGLTKNKLTNNVIKMKKHTSNTNKKKNYNNANKIYLNRNAQAIIQLAETYSDKNGKISFEKLKELAELEDIEGKKFYIHFNRACYLKYIKKDKNDVYFLKSYN